MTSNSNPQSTLPQQETKKNQTRSGALVASRDALLLAQYDRTHGALRNHGHSIGVKINSATVVKKEGESFRKADTAYGKVCAELREVLLPRQEQIDAEACQFILETKHVLKNRFGPKWSPAWGEMGFKDNTLAMPKSIEQRSSLVERLGAWIAGHPEVENASLGVTAENASGIHKRLTDVLNDVDAQKAKQRKLSGDRKASREALRKRMRDVIRELGLLLPDDDQRWLSFDLTQPSVLKDRRNQARSRTLKAKAALAAQAAGITPVLRALQDSAVQSSAAAAA